jgi:hypothetical protein
VHVFRDVSYEHVRHACILLSFGAPRKRLVCPRVRVRDATWMPELRGNGLVAVSRCPSMVRRRREGALP